MPNTPRRATPQRIPAPMPRLAIAISILSLTLGGCIVFPNSEDTGAGSPDASGSTYQPSAKPGQITMSELDALTKAYADRYMTLVVAACDDIIENNPSLEQRRMANMFKTASVTAIYDVATNPDPFTQLIDMLLVVTLQSMVWIDEDNASLAFPGRDEILVLALRRAREDVWELARSVMTAKQLDDLDRLMVEWRRQNQDVQFVSFVRFGDFADRRGKSIISEVRSGGGLLAPAKQAIDETRLLAERIFYISKRAPFVLSWQAQSLVDDLLIKPEVSAALAQLEQVADAADRAATAAESIPGLITSEREALISELDTREEQLSQTLTAYRAAVADTRSLLTDANTTMSGVEQVTESLNQTIAAVDTLLANQSSRSPKNADAEPFTIEPYAAALRDLTVAVQELNTLVSSTGSLVGSPALDARLEQLNQAADAQLAAARSHGGSLIDLIFVRAAMLAAFIFLLAVAHLLISMLLKRDDRKPNKPAGVAA